MAGVQGCEGSPYGRRGAQQRECVLPVDRPLTAAEDPRSHPRAGHGRPVGLVRSRARRIALRAHEDRTGIWEGFLARPA